MNRKVALNYLEALYNSTGQTPVDEAMYNNLKKFIDNSGEIKETKEYKDLEREWYFEKQLCGIYKNRINSAALILGGKYDKKK